MRMHGDMAIGHMFLVSPFPLFVSALEALLGTFGTRWVVCVSFLIPLMLVGTTGAAQRALRRVGRVLGYLAPMGSLFGIIVVYFPLGLKG